MNTSVELGFISRHTPTDEQITMARNKGYKLVHLGDIDAFNDGEIRALVDRTQCAGYVVVHPALALTLATLEIPMQLGVFENASRAAEGEKPQFYAKSLKIWQVN